MRTILYTITLLALAPALEAHAQDSVLSTCNTTLIERLRANKDVGTADCRITISDGQTPVTADFRVSVVKAPGTEAKLMVREMCEQCGTQGPTQKFAIDFDNLTENILARAAGNTVEGQTVAAESTIETAAPAPTEAPADACVAPNKSKTDTLSCYIATLNKATDPSEATAYFQAKIQPEMLRLARSKVEADKLFLQRLIMVANANFRGVARTQVVVDTLEQFNQFLGYRQRLEQISREVENVRKMPPTPAPFGNPQQQAFATQQQAYQRSQQSARVQGLEQERQRTFAAASAVYTNQANMLAQRGILDETLNQNGQQLLALLGGGVATPSLNPAAAGQQPRMVYGNPGGMPSNGIVPRRTQGSIFN